MKMSVKKLVVCGVLALVGMLALLGCAMRGSQWSTYTGVTMGLITIHVVVRFLLTHLIQFASWHPHEARFVFWLLKVCRSRGYEAVMLFLVVTLLVSALFPSVVTGCPWSALGGFLALVLAFVVVLTAIEVQKLVSGDSEVQKPVSSDSGGREPVVGPEEMKALLGEDDGDTQPPSTDGPPSSQPNPLGTEEDGSADGK